MQQGPPKIRYTKLFINNEFVDEVKGTFISPGRSLTVLSLLSLHGTFLYRWLPWRSLLL